MPEPWRMMAEIHRVLFKQSTDRRIAPTELALEFWLQKRCGTSQPYCTSEASFKNTGFEAQSIGGRGVGAREEKRRIRSPL